MSADDSPEDDGNGRSGGVRAKKGAAAAAGGNTKTKRNARQQDQNKQVRKRCYYLRYSGAAWGCGAHTTLAGAAATLCKSMWGSAIQPRTGAGAW